MLQDITVKTLSNTEDGAFRENSSLQRIAFCENRLLTFNYFCKKRHHRYFADFWICQGKKGKKQKIMLPFLGLFLLLWKVNALSHCLHLTLFLRLAVIVREKISLNIATRLLKAKVLFWKDFLAMSSRYKQNRIHL